MPPKSKAQARFMRAAASGSISVKGLSKKEAKEFVEGHKTKSLPARKTKKNVRKKTSKKKTAQKKK